MFSVSSLNEKMLGRKLNESGFIRLVNKYSFIVLAIPFTLIFLVFITTQLELYTQVVSDTAFPEDGSLYNYFAMMVVQVSTNLLVIASAVNFIRYISGKVSKQLFVTSIILGASYLLSTVLMWFMPAPGADPEDALQRFFIMYPIYSIFDAGTILALMLVVPKFIEVEDFKIQCFPFYLKLTLVLLLVNGIFHLVYISSVHLIGDMKFEPNMYGVIFRFIELSYSITL